MSKTIFGMYKEDNKKLQIENLNLKDKLRRRNMQIKDLQEQLKRYKQFQKTPIEFPKEGNPYLLNSNKIKETMDKRNKG